MATPLKRDRSRPFPDSDWPAGQAFPEPLAIPPPVASLVESQLRVQDLVAQIAEDVTDACPIGKHEYEYLCGTAGTGKTFQAKRLAEEQLGVELCATTGIAAVNLGEGTTIHSLLGFFDTADLKAKFTDGRIQGKLRRLRSAGLRRIVLDEVSMLDGRALTILTRAIAEVNEVKDKGLDTIGETSEAARAYAESMRVDGEEEKIGLTLVGDFGQLPPVPDEDWKTKKKIPATFAFESEEWWRYAPHVTKLTKIWRQDAQDFVRALHAVRSGDVRAAMEFFHAGRFETNTDDKFDGSTIFAKNDAVDRYNQLRMDDLKTPMARIECERWGKPRGEWKQIPDILALKEGALVMVLANKKVYEDEEDKKGRYLYTNGDLGVFLGVGMNGTWRVRLQRNGVEVPIYPVTRHNTIPLEAGRKAELKAQCLEEIGMIWREDKLEPDDVLMAMDAEERLSLYVDEEGKNEIIGSVVYMPLRLAYGCTVHKTQGLTLDKVQVNIRDPFFQQPGMLFVALSRCRTAEGLRLIGTPQGFAERCRVDPRVQPWL